MNRLGLAALAACVLAAPALAQVPAPPTGPTPPPAPPAVETPAPPAPPAPPPPPPEPLKPLPTAGEPLQVLSALDHACVPLVGGADAKSVATAAGMRINRDGDLYINFDGGQKISILAPSPANPQNCSMTVVYATGGGDALLEALQAWVARRPTPLPADKVAASQPDDKGVSIISTWVHYGPPTTEGLVFVQHKRADGTPLSSRNETAEVLFSIRPG
jgi:hypothetical protein